MFYALGWLVIFSLLALWSFTVWAFHAAASWVVSQGGAVSGVVTEAVAESVKGAAQEAGTAITGLGLPEWLAPWVGPWLEPAVGPLREAAGALSSGLAPLVGSLLQAAPSLAGVLDVAGWLVWAVGAVMLVVLGVVLHVASAIWQRRRAAAGGNGGAGGAGRLASAWHGLTGLADRRLLSVHSGP